MTDRKPPPVIIRTRDPMKHLDAITVPGMSKRDTFFYWLGQTIALVVSEKQDSYRFSLPAPDEETRLLGEVAVEIRIAKLGGDAARRLSENLTITVGGKSSVRHANELPTPRPRKPTVH